VLEVTEDIDPDDEVVEACGRLRKAGYAIALDDFVLSDRTARFIPLASYIKVDFLTSSEEARREIRARSSGPAVRLLAEKIETVEAFEQARREGFTYFQGYFFGRPTIKTGGEIPGQHLQSMRMLAALQNPDLSAAQLEAVIKSDVRLCYLILRSANSAASAVQSKVRSIRDATVLVGRDAIRRWASLWLLAGLGATGHPELIAMAMTRAHCCEQLAASDDVGGGDGFLVGLCSLLEAMLGRPIEELLEHLPLDDQARAALLGEDNALRRMLDSVIAYERGDWPACLEHSARAGLASQQLAAAYNSALRSAQQFRSTAV
jgi:EAL and modified HD-GYP domain-containing signal transduction protein